MKNDQFVNLNYLTQRSPRTHIWNLFCKKVLSTLFVLRTCTFLAGTRTKMYTWCGFQNPSVYISNLYISKCTLQCRTHGTFLVRTQSVQKLKRVQKTEREKIFKLRWKWLILNNDSLNDSRKYQENLFCKYELKF